MPLKIQVTPDRQHAHLIFESEGESMTHVMIASEVEDLIDTLGQARNLLADQVPMEIEPVIHANVLPNPRWYVVPYVHEGSPSKVLMVRHPGFGWLRFLIPANEAVNMGGALSAN